jgi:hypothetical protein
MANVKLDWGNPLDTSDMTSIRLFRLNSGESTNVNQAFVDPANNGSYLSDASLLEDIAVYISKSTQVYEELNPVANGAGTYTDTGLDSGTYHYGAFSHNAGGYGPGTVVTVSV